MTRSMTRSNVNHMGFGTSMGIGADIWICAGGETAAYDWRRHVYVVLPHLLAYSTTGSGVRWAARGARTVTVFTVFNRF